MEPTDDDVKRGDDDDINRVLLRSKVFLMRSSSIKAECDVILTPTLLRLSCHRHQLRQQSQNRSLIAAEQLPDSNGNVKSTGCSYHHVISLADVVGTSVNDSYGRCQNVDLSTKRDNEMGAWLEIYWYPRCQKSNSSKSASRERKVVTLGFGSQKTPEENNLEASKWHEAIVSLIRCKTDVQRKLKTTTSGEGIFLVLVNPFSGQGNALKLFQQHAAPMFAEAGLQYEVIVTERAGHAREIVRTARLQEWDGLIIASGDGLVFEVINGLMDRADWREAINTPIGVLPCGSGNCLSVSLAYQAGEQYHNDCVKHAAFMICKRSARPMDLVVLETGSGQRLYSFMMVSWGFIADVDIESERYRIIGDARFTLGTIIRLIGLRRYRARLSYLPFDDNDDSGKASTSDVRPTPRYLPPLGTSLPPNWVTIEDDFLTVAAVYQTHLARDLRIVPQSRLVDGKIHLYVSHAAATGRMKVLKIFQSMQEELPSEIPEGTRIIAARAFRLEPIGGGPAGRELGIMTVDGERIECGPIQGEVLPAMAHVLTTSNS